MHVGTSQVLQIYAPPSALIEPRPHKDTCLPAGVQATSQGTAATSGAAAGSPIGSAPGSSVPKSQPSSDSPPGPSGGGAPLGNCFKCGQSGVQLLGNKQACWPVCRPTQLVISQCHFLKSDMLVLPCASSGNALDSWLQWALLKLCPPTGHCTDACLGLHSAWSCMEDLWLTVAFVKPEGSQ